MISFVWLSCLRCRAIVGVEASGGQGFSHLEEHMQWHADLDERLNRRWWRRRRNRS